MTWAKIIGIILAIAVVLWLLRYLWIALPIGVLIYYFAKGKGKLSKGGIIGVSLVCIFSLIYFIGTLDSTPVEPVLEANAPFASVSQNDDEPNTLDNSSARSSSEQSASTSSVVSESEPSSSKPSSSVASSTPASSTPASSTTPQPSSTEQSNTVINTETPVTDSVAPADDYIQDTAPQNDFNAEGFDADAEDTMGTPSSHYACWTPNGKSYHYSSSCATLSRSKTIIEGTVASAISNGKSDPCNVCAGG